MECCFRVTVQSWCKFFVRGSGVPDFMNCCLRLGAFLWCTWGLRLFSTRYYEVLFTVGCFVIVYVWERSTGYYGLLVAIRCYVMVYVGERLSNTRIYAALFAVGCSVLVYVLERLFRSTRFYGVLFLVESSRRDCSKI